MTVPPPSRPTLDLMLHTLFCVGRCPCVRSHAFVFALRVLNLLLLAPNLKAIGPGREPTAVPDINALHWSFGIRQQIIFKHCHTLDHRIGIYSCQIQCKPKQKLLHWICLQIDAGETSKDSLQSGRNSKSSFEKKVDVYDGPLLQFCCERQF